MKQVPLFTLLFLAMSLYGKAKNKKQQDQEAIKKMCGCYEVKFDFAETFEYSNDSTYSPSQVKHDKGLEWVELVEDLDNKIVMQHLLIVGPLEKQSVIKHWRQDWLFENRDLYTYTLNNTWHYNKLTAKEVQGQWTQKVFQVDDSPRYEGSATWVHVDGKSFWENTTDAPLPRREYTKRNDYNVTARGNRHEITKYGWIHDQNNHKIIRTFGEQDIILAKEKGLNTYTKVADIKCKAARDWWSKNKSNWALVRSKWDTVFSKKADLKLERKVDDKPLYKHLFAKEFIFNKARVSQIINKYLKK